MTDEGATPKLVNLPGAPFNSTLSKAKEAAVLSVGVTAPVPLSFLHAGIRNNTNAKPDKNKSLMCCIK
jgi:hypothetical protein